MKPINLILFIFLALTAHAQTIRRVNNNTGVTGVNVYTTAQAAHDAAAANDVLMIEPSSVSYGNLTLSKPLKIYGNGFFLDQNPELKADRRPSTLGTINFDTGSDGAVLNGISCGDLNIKGSSNITIHRNAIVGRVTIDVKNMASVPTNISNVYMSSNNIYINAGSGARAISLQTFVFQATYIIDRCFITNNFIGSSDFAISADNPNNLTNIIINNNTFTWQGNIVLGNAVFENNILAGGGSLAFSNVVYNNNISTGNTFSGGIGNQSNYNVASQFIATGSSDEYYQIKTGSPLKTAGSGGIEVGAFGGVTPYIISGIPPIPSITNMNSTSIGSNSTPLSVTISVKSNN
jgi:hypothetical protein